MRSFRSFVIEKALNFSKKETNPVLFIEKKLADQENLYVIPDKLIKKYHIEKEVAFDMDTYHLKSKENFESKHILYLHSDGSIEQPLIFHWSF